MPLNPEQMGSADAVVCEMGKGGGEVGMGILEPLCPSPSKSGPDVLTDSLIASYLSSVLLVLKMVWREFLLPAIRVSDGDTEYSGQ